MSNVELRISYYLDTDKEWLVLFKGTIEDGDGDEISFTAGPFSDLQLETEDFTHVTVSPDFINALSDLSDWVDEVRTSLEHDPSMGQDLLEAMLLSSRWEYPRINPNTLILERGSDLTG